MTEIIDHTSVNEMMQKQNHFMCLIVCVRFDITEFVNKKDDIKTSITGLVFNRKILKYKTYMWTLHTCTWKHRQLYLRQL